jgi:hypothetical protein
MPMYLLKRLCAIDKVSKFRLPPYTILCISKWVAFALPPSSRLNIIPKNFILCASPCDCACFSRCRKNSFRTRPPLSKGSLPQSPQIHSSQSLERHRKGYSFRAHTPPQVYTQNHGRPDHSDFTKASEVGGGGTQRLTGCWSCYLSRFSFSQPQWWQLTEGWSTKNSSLS